MTEEPTSVALLGGRYRHLRELGRGGSGRVVLVRDEFGGVERAVKMVPPASRDRLVWEFELLRRIAHPNLATVHELLLCRDGVGEPFHLSPGSAVLVEDFVEGTPAGRLTAAVHGHARWLLALKIADDVCSALCAIHDAGLLHGDLKPDNILARADGSAVLVDLGLAGPPLEADGRLRGTPALLAPEAWAGTRSVATDLFALGATLAQLLAGRGESPPLRSSPPSPLSVDELPAAIPPELRALIGGLLAPDPAERPDDARETLARIRQTRRSLGEAVSPQALGEPSPQARALAASRVPYVGPSAPLERLVDALRDGGVVRVGGPDGAGRSRLIEEATVRLQREAADAGRPVPTYVAAAAPCSPPNGACVLHLRGPVDEVWLERELGAAAVAGRSLAVVVEEAEGADIRVGPLHADALGTLVERLLGRQDEALRRAAQEVSGGLAGRLCRIVADAFAAGCDPTRPDVLGAAVRFDGATDEWSDAIDRLALAGGSLPVDELPLSAAEARRLTSRGQAWIANGRWVLRRDLVERRRGRAKAFETQDRRAAAYLAAAAGDPEAAAAFAALIDEAFDAGDIAEAERLAADASRLVGGPELALRHADALRAAGRYDEALNALDGHQGSGIAAARAEIARRAGRRELAEEAAREAGEAGTLTRAWLTLSDPDGPAPTDEVRAWKALVAGGLQDAERHAWAGLRAHPGESRQARQARARLHATLGAVLQARGDLAGAAKHHRRARDLARALGERHLTATALANLGAVQLDAGVLGEGRQALLDAGRELLRLGRDRDAGRALANLASVSLWIGDESTAARVCEQAEEAANRADDEEARSIAWLLRLELALRVGDLGRAWALAERSPTGTSPTVALVRTRAAGLLAPHDPDRAASLRDRSAPAFEGWLADARLALARRQAPPTLSPPEPPDTWEQRLLLAFLEADLAAAAGDGSRLELAGARARELLDEAARSLDPTQRRRLRRVPAHQRVLAHRPAQRTEASQDRWRRLAARAKRLTPERDLQWLREEVVDAAVELVDAERGFWIERTERGRLTVRAGLDHDEEMAISRSVVARALDSRRPVWALDALEDERLREAGSVHALALRSVLCVPLRWRGRDAALYVDDRSRPAAFDEEDGALLADLAELAAIALHGAERLRAERAATAQLEQARRRLLGEVEAQRAQLASLRACTPDLVAASPAMRRTMDLVARVAPAELPVLVVGESGTGKERIARAIHAMSPRCDGPFIAESCAAIADTLLESALFGHERGAFTGANRARRGLFELADGGTLLLDEVGEMSPAMQAKLLRVLQEGELRRVGAQRTRRIDVRVIAATHRDLKAMVEAGNFREDLYYRLAVVTVEVPPLRERPEDLPGLVQAALDEHARTQGRRVSITAAALDALARAPWPGNVRQLHNTIERALLAADDTIDVPHLELDGKSPSTGTLDLKGRIAALERELIEEAMRRCGHNQTHAARLLGVSRYGLQKKLKRLGIS